jgi:hypothetical protein
MKRFVVCIAILLISVTLSGITYWLTPSATDVVFGARSGGANIWNRNPLDVWSNPAKLGYYDKFCTGTSDVEIQDKYIDEPVSFSASYITFGLNGVGIMMPMINTHSRFGYSYSETYYYPYPSWEAFESYNFNSEFALGINLLKFCKNYTNNDLIDKLEYYSDLSIGYNYDIVFYDYALSAIEIPSGQQEYMDGLGMIWRVSPLNQSNNKKLYDIKADIAASMYYRGITSQYDETVTTAASIRLAWGNEYLKDIIDPAAYNFLSAFSSNLISVYASYDNIEDDNMDWDNDEYSYGYEITLFDLLSLRKGKDNDETEYNLGWGINLRYKDMIQFQMNKAEFHSKQFNDRQTITDYMLKLDLLRVIKKINAILGH